MQDIVIFLKRQPLSGKSPNFDLGCNLVLPRNRKIAKWFLFKPTYLKNFNSSSTSYPMDFIGE